MPQGGRMLAVLMLITACAAWGFSFPFWKALDLWWRQVDPAATSVFTAVWGLALRFVIAAAALAAIQVLARCLHRATAREWRQALELAGLTALAMALQMDALAHTQATTSAFLTQGYAVILPLHVCLRRRCWPRPLMVLAVVLVMLGAALLTGFGTGSLTWGRGELETVAATVVMTAQILVVESPRFAGNRALVMTLRSFLATALLLGAAGLFLTHSVSTLAAPLTHPAAFGVLLVLALVSTLAGNGLMYLFQGRVGAVAAGITYCSEPVFASAYALVLPSTASVLLGIDYANEKLTSSLLAGGGLILAAIVAIQCAGQDDFRAGIRTAPA